MICMIKRHYKAFSPHVNMKTRELRVSLITFQLMALAKVFSFGNFHTAIITLWGCN